MLTILIPTRNRWNFLGRLLRYYASAGVTWPIVIGDSSDAEELVVGQKILKEVSGRLKVDYRSCPGLSNLACGTSLLERVSTPYVVWTADDDFLALRGVRSALEFLETHADYSTAHGAALLFTVGGDMPHGEVGIVSRYPQRSVEQDSGVRRFISHVGDYNPTVHSVHRTKNLLESYRRVIELNMDNNFGELAPSSIPTIRGKVKRLKVLYMVRQCHGGMTSRKTSPKIFDWITMPDWPNQWGRFRECIAEELSRQDRISVDEARQVVQQVMWRFLAKAMMAKMPRAESIGKPAFQPSWGLASWRRPDPAKVWRNVCAFITGEEREVTLKTVLRPSFPHHADFMPIYQAVTSR